MSLALPSRKFCTSHYMDNEKSKYYLNVYITWVFVWYKNGLELHFKGILWLHLPPGEHSRKRLRWDPLRACADLTAAFVQLFTPGVRVSPAVSFTRREPAPLDLKPRGWMSLITVLPYYRGPLTPHSAKNSYLSRTHTHMHRYEFHIHSIYILFLNRVLKLQHNLKHR